MKIASLSSLLVLCGCVTAPTLDYSKIESVCAQRCSSEYSNCTAGFKLFPLVAQAQCNESLQVCVKVCPEASASIGQKGQSTTSQKLTELNSLYKQGLISEKDFNAKKEEILKGM
jgi:hypothetical protein